MLHDSLPFDSNHNDQDWSHKIIASSLSDTCQTTSINIQLHLKWNLQIPIDIFNQKIEFSYIECLHRNYSTPKEHWVKLNLSENFCKNNQQLPWNIIKHNLKLQD